MSADVDLARTKGNELTGSARKKTIPKQALVLANKSMHCNGWRFFRKVLLTEFIISEEEQPH